MKNVQDFLEFINESAESKEELDFHLKLNKDKIIPTIPLPKK